APDAPGLDHAYRLADEGRGDEALAAVRACVEREGPSAAACYLEGVLLDAAGRPEEAEAALRRALYLEPGHYDALVFLALLAERAGDVRAAEGYRRRAARVAQASGDAAGPDRAAGRGGRR
ncbi:tetratricopeptide repeat protein, partial [Dissulfurirhabdus thermomarina]|nr:tetratricopeptide repeat protein [Dissulfurirhabdus thermomarina]